VTVQNSALPSLTHSGSDDSWILIICAAIAAAALALVPLRTREMLGYASAGVDGIRSRQRSRVAAPSGEQGVPRASEHAVEYGPSDGVDEAVDALALGALLAKDGDVDGAMAVYYQAAQRGDPASAFSLGALLEAQGETESAMAAYRRAGAGGELRASVNLGILLAEHGDLSGALAAFDSADQRGDAAAAFNLGLLLEEHGDTSAAAGAYRRAQERGSAEIADMAQRALSDLNVGIDR
jgi:tetratricopeptide (TPR) repeat protein